jgi:hypothetical protein
MEQTISKPQTRIHQTDRYSLTPAGYAALDAYDAETALTANSDVYDVTMAFDAALAAADPAAVLRFMARFPLFADDLVAVGYARFAFGLTLTDTVDDGAALDTPPLALGRA